MYALKNKVQLIGQVVGEPEVTTTESGKKHVNFCVGINEVYRDAIGEKKMEVQLHKLVGWGKIAEITEKFVKNGSIVLIEGKLINRTVFNKEGAKESVSEVMLHEILVI